MPSSGVKFFSSILAYGLVPLLIAAQSNKVSYLVVLDLTVWLVAVAALCYLVKAPWELWVLSKAKSKEIEERKKLGENVTNVAADLRAIEYKMYYIAMLTPFLAAGGWHFLAQFVAKYGLNAMTEIVHPYFILIVGIMAGLYPVHKYYSKMKHDLRVPHVHIPADLENMVSLMKQKQDVIEKLQRQIEAEVVKNEANRLKMEREVKSLKKELRMANDAKTDDLIQMERRLTNVESQVEISQHMLRDATSHQKGIIDTLVSTPMKLIYSGK